MSNQTLQSILGSKTVSFYAIFAKAIGSVPAAVMLSQAFFWQEECRYKKHLIDLKGKLFFQKTAEEWYEETGLTKEQQLTARKNLRERGILQEELAGMPATTHYRVDIDGLVAVINRYLLERDTVAVKHRNKMRQMPRASSGKFRQQDAVKDGNSYNIESLESKKESEKEREPQAAFITTHTPNQIENIEVVIVEGETFGLEEKTNLEPITPAAREHDSQILQDFANMGTDAEFEDVKRRMTAKPRTPKPAGNSTTSVCAEIKTPEVLDFFHAIHAAWREWTDYKRRERKGTYKSAKSEAATITELANEVNCDPEAARAAIQRSIAKTYTGICPDKNWKSATPPPRYSLEDRPQATTPTEMMKEAISFYQQNPKVWRDATLFGKVTEWTQEKHKDFLLKFCARQIADGRGRDTFGEINARLQAWFLNENKHQNPAQQQHTAGPQPQAPLRSAAPVNYSTK